MTTGAVEYVIPSSWSLNKIKATLIKKLRLIELPSEKLEISCLDTFDWRLFDHNLVLESSQQGQGCWLRCRELCSRNYRYAITTDKVVDFSWSLPESPLKEILSSRLKVRALVSQVRLRVSRYPLAKVNQDQKTVMRIFVEEYKVFNDSSESYCKLQKRIAVVPLTGYVKPLQKAIKFIERERRLAKSNKDIIVVALNALGRKRIDYSSKLNILLRPEMQSAVACKILLQQMLDIMIANEKGILDDIDTEFLHDFRIAIRKSRSALKQIKAVFPQQAPNNLQNQFCWLGNITSPTRDMDVYLLKLDSYRNMLPVELQGDLESLRKLLEEKRRSAHKTLVRALNSRRYENFKLNYQDFLQAPLRQKTTLANARRPIKTVAGERIWKMYKRVIKEGAAIRDNSPAEDLHELRKTCKKLRYLVDFFQSMYDEKAVKNLLKALKHLQNNLGEYNDLHIQMEKLKEFTEELAGKHTLSPGSGKAMSLLILHLEKLQDAERKKFTDRFARFSDFKVKQQFRRLYKPMKSAVKESPCTS